MWPCSNSRAARPRNGNVTTNASTGPLSKMHAVFFTALKFQLEILGGFSVTHDSSQVGQRIKSWLPGEVYAFLFSLFLSARKKASDLLEKIGSDCCSSSGWAPMFSCPGDWEEQLNISCYDRRPSLARSCPHELTAKSFCEIPILHPYAWKFQLLPLLVPESLGFIHMTIRYFIRLVGGISQLFFHCASGHLF